MSALPMPPAEVTPDNAEFFAGLEEDRVTLPRCQRCGQAIWFPRHFCANCGSSEVGWFQASGRGIVYSFTVVRQSQGEWTGAVPYVLSYVELDEGPRILTNLLAEPEAVRIGAAVEAVIDRSPDAPPILRFRLR